MTVRGLIAVLGAAVCATAVTGVAVAHDEAEAAYPKKGAALKKLPPQVRVTWGEPVGRLNRVTVTRNGKGNLVKAARIDRSNARRVVATLKRPGRKWQPGKYRVTWRITAADGHRQTLVVPFTVKKR